jgi:hypothetical protein
MLAAASAPASAHCRLNAAILDLTLFLRIHCIHCFHFLPLRQLQHKLAIDIDHAACDRSHKRASSRAGLQKAPPAPWQELKNAKRLKHFKYLLFVL